MLLLILSRLWVLVFEDEVNLIAISIKKGGSPAIERAYLVGSSAFVGTKHDDIG